MNTPELIYQSIKFFFSDFWIYAGLLLLVLVIRGDVTKALIGVKDFFKKTVANYREKRKHINQFQNFREKISKIKPE